MAARVHGIPVRVAYPLTSPLTVHDHGSLAGYPYTLGLNVGTSTLPSNCHEPGMTCIYPQPGHQRPYPPCAPRRTALSLTIIYLPIGPRAVCYRHGGRGFLAVGGIVAKTVLGTDAVYACVYRITRVGSPLFIQPYRLTRRGL